ncbi:hypothetical protein RJ639_036874 [Escallonia herrerae]|uniref:Uncharacterized protein n=1 Tax=Escallonia herrerae TaxID=1293975 RepID=A0AA88WR69_9ASTE|nr:hypothetical protein RJ639_036874 [Escallonia herrerae]
MKPESKNNKRVGFSRKTGIPKDVDFLSGRVPQMNKMIIAVQSGLVEVGGDEMGVVDNRIPRFTDTGEFDQGFHGSGDGQGGSSFATGQSDDKLSTNYGGLDLEALSRLDGRRWSSSCRSQEGLELVAVNRDGEEESMTESIRTLSQKYRPMFFEELIGQNIVVQSLMNAILRGRVASLYLFQGPRGTGKTSTARVLAAALNCLASNKTKPCGSSKAPYQLIHRELG